MKTALRYTGWFLVIDAALLVVMFIGLWLAAAVGMDIQSLKWPTVFYGGVLIMLLMLAGVIWAVLSSIAFFAGRKVH